MPRFAFVSGSYTAQSGAIADSECINLFAESNEDGPPATQGTSYGGTYSGSIKSYLGTPGLAVFSTLPAGPIRGQIACNGRLFVVADTNLYEVMADGTAQDYGNVYTDGKAVSMAFNSIQLLVVSALHAFCFTLTADGWQADHLYAVGDLIEDANGHIQKATPSAWAASTTYALGAQIVDGNGNIQKAQQAQWQPATAYDVDAEIVDVAGHVQKASAVSWKPSTAYAAGTQIVDTNGNIQQAVAAQWVANQAYAINYQIIDLNGNIQKVTTAGTSGATTPVWATSGTTSDGAVVWTYQGSSGGNAGTSGSAQPVWGTSVTLDNSPLYWVYVSSANGKAGASGAVIPTFSDAGGTVLDNGTLQWTDQGIASNAGTSGTNIPNFTTSGSVPDNGTLIWTYVGPSSGNAGTSGSIAPSFNDVGGTVADGPDTLTWVDQGTRLLDVTPQLAGAPIQCDATDAYFVVCFYQSNKFQISQVLDGTSWPGQLVNAVSVFADNIVSIKVNHRELWVYGIHRTQPYQDTGSANVFDVIQGALIETGNVATFSTCRVDNSLFWVGQDERGALIAWRSNGYTPARISTHAVEVWLRQQQGIADLVSYSYQDGGHLFWVLYVRDSDCSWVYDVGEGMWHKRAAWVNEKYEPHWSWNHAYCFGKTLVGDWKTGNIYQMSADSLTDNGTNIRRLRRAPTITNEKDWIYHSQLTVDFQAGVGPQPPLEDGDGNPREPEAALRWSDDRGQNWSNQHVRGLGMAGQYNKRVFWMRLGRSRNRVYELVVTDPVPVAIVDSYIVYGK